MSSPKLYLMLWSKQSMSQARIAVNRWVARQTAAFVSASTLIIRRINPVIIRTRETATLSSRRPKPPWERTRDPWAQIKETPVLTFRLWISDFTIFCWYIHFFYLHQHVFFSKMSVGCQWDGSIVFRLSFYKSGLEEREQPFPLYQSLSIWSVCIRAGFYPVAALRGFIYSLPNSFWSVSTTTHSRVETWLFPPLGF